MAPGVRYYELLEIPRTAGPDDLKKAYRKLSLRWHPDKNPDNREEAEERFKELAEAYSVLSDAEMRARYDRYGEDGLRRGFQPPSESYGASSGGGPTHGHGGAGFEFRPAHDIFRDFFGGHDPFASMQMGSMFGADPFANAFFSAPMAMQPGFPSMFGGPPGGGGGGFGSFFSAGPMAAGGSFSFVSSSVAGGPGGMRGPSGPSICTSVQIVNGVKIQTIEEDDGRGNVTITHVSPDGYREVIVNGVPQGGHSGGGPPRRNIRHDMPPPQSHPPPPPQSQPQPPKPQRRDSSTNHHSHAQSRPRPSDDRPSTRHSRAPSDTGSVIEVMVVDDDDDDDDEDNGHGPAPVSAPAPAPTSRREEPARRSSGAKATSAAAAAAAAATVAAAASVASASTAGRRGRASSVATEMHQPPRAPRGSTAAPPAPAPRRNEAEDSLAAARNNLRPLSSAPAPSGREHPHSAAPQKPMGLKDKLKVTGASMLRSRPRANRAHSASKVSMLPPEPQQPQSLPAVHHPAPATYPAPAAYQAPPPPKPQRSYGERSHGPVYRPAPLHAGGSESSAQATAGRSTPGHKQPRSRDRLRSTLHYDSFSPADLDAITNSLAGPVPMQRQPALRPQPAQSGPQAYSAQPLSATQARNMRQEQQQQQQQGALGGSAGVYRPQHAGVPPGAATVGGPYAH